MDQRQILERITAMVDDERRLRDALADGRGDDGGAEERARLAALERELDQCWDLLRQRRAKTEWGQDPEEARVRPSSQVEGYQS
ncbi:DUF2630 family protein [Streptomyces sp. NPDC049906]|uniref:DUF2630 family protein n=1 Tax=Streptomyces sp. NPDC049906 TaxID=3155656 RepID=UPI00341F1306